MFKKRQAMLILLSLLVCIVAVASVSAADSDLAGGDVADEDNIALDEDTGDIVSNAEDDVVASDVENQDKIANDEQNNDVVSMEDNKDILSASSPTYDKYSVEFDDYEYEIDESGGYVYFDIYPNSDTNYYAYDFYLKVYDQSGSVKHSKNLYSSNSEDYESSYKYLSYYLPELSAGTYTMKLINYKDSHEYDSADLYVEAEEEEVTPVTISTSYYSTYYNSNKKFNIKVTEQGTGSAASYVSLKVVFKKGSKTVTKYVTTGSDGKVSFVPGLEVGTWTVTTSVNDYYYTGSSKTSTAKISKSSVKIKLKKVSQYQGIKFKLKATVKNQAGKNVKEGKVKFRIKGKTYYAAVKNGVATKKIKIGKVGKYKLSAKYMGNKNLKKKSAKKIKVKIKKRYKTKVTANKKLYKMTYGNTVTIKLKVKTTSGKRVKGGYIDVYNKETGNYLGWVKVSKKGKATVKLTLAHNYISGNGYTSFYKKVVYSKYKMKYSPTTYKYKCSSKTVKIKEKYKCQYCGKTKSHKHNMGYYVWHIYVN